MSRDEALKILLATGYCEGGKYLRCEDCPYYDADLIEDLSCCPTEKQISVAVAVIEAGM